MASQPAKQPPAASTPKAVIEALQDAMEREVDVTVKFTIDGRRAGDVSPIALTLRGRIADVAAAGLVLVLTPGPSPALLSAGPNVWATVSLMAGSHELVFFAQVASPAIPGPETPPETTTIALRLPTEVIKTHRRRNFRIAASNADGVELKIWRIEEHSVLRDQPRASQRFKCDLHELSADGFGATLHAHRVEAMQLKAGQRFRVQLITLESEALFEARLIHPKVTARDDISARCGFQFVEDDDNFEYRRSCQKLDAILAKLQRLAAASASARQNAA